MKCLIAFASKSGTAKACAEALLERIPGGELRDLTREKPNPDSYDLIIVGGGVRMGQWHVDARQYLALHGEALLKKPLGLYLCCGRDDAADTLFDNNVQPELLRHAFAHAAFGGEIDIKRVKGFERIILKMAMKDMEKGGEMPSLHMDRVDAFAREALLAAQAGSGQTSSISSNTTGMSGENT